MHSKLEKIYFNFLKQIFEPICRFALKRGLKFQDLTEILKHSFISSAKEELSSLETEVNTSRLAVVTGLQRKDITRVLSFKDDQIKPNSEFLD